MNSDHTQGYQKHFMIRYLSSFLSPLKVCMWEDKWSCLVICLQKPVHTLVTAMMLKKCVPSSTCSSFLQTSGEKSYLWNAAKGNLSTIGTLACPRRTLLLWPKLCLGPVTYELSLNSIIAWDFIQFCVQCVCLCCLWVFSSFSNISQSLKEKSILYC